MFDEHTIFAMLNQLALVKRDLYGDVPCTSELSGITRKPNMAVVCS